MALSFCEARRPHSPIARTVAATLLLLISAFTLSGVWEQKEALEREDFEHIAQLDSAIDAIVGPESRLSTPDERLCPAMLYSRHRWAPPLGRPEHEQYVLDILRARDEGRASFKKFVIILTEASRKTWPEFTTFIEKEAAARGVTPITQFGWKVYPL